MADLILVVLHEPERTHALLDSAHVLAGLLGTDRITALAAREPIRVPALSSEIMAHEADAILAARREEEQRLLYVRDAFDAWSAAARAPVKWVDEEGAMAALVEERGSRADVIVLDRPLDDDDLPARQAVRAALFATERPVLMLPPDRPPRAFGRCVAVAWKDDQRMWKALIPALRFLDHAEEVHVLVGLQQGAPRAAISPALEEHGVRGHLHMLQVGAPPFGETLLAKARELGADMLIMGAYAHSPLRQFVLGGVTRYMLSHADLPVFLRH